MANKRRKLLIVDDDTIVRQSIVAYLEDSGFDIYQASDGASGLDAFRAHSPELIISDLRMPGVDGLQLLKQVHADSPDFPVIVVSGAGVVGDVVEALHLGACDYLIKPIVDMEMLVYSVNKALERQDLLVENRLYREKLEVVNRDMREHLRLLELDHEAGQQAQRRLLPPTPVQRGDYHIEHLVKPSLYLSGDFVDYAYRSDRYLSFYLADVSGHGVSSAFMTIWLKHLISHMSVDEGLFGNEQSFANGTSTALQAVNDEMLASRLSNHLTMIIGVIDTQTSKMRYSIGGHLPLPVLITDEGAQFLPGKGKPLGLFKGIDWEVYEQDLPEEFTLACFSDGILEVSPPQALQEKEDYLLSVLSKKGHSLEEIVTELALDKIHEAPDDIAIMTISKHASLDAESRH